MKGTLKELITNEFGIDLNTLPVMDPVNVEDANIGIYAYNEEKGINDWAKIQQVLKKDKQSSYSIRLKGKAEFEQPMAGKHLLAIYKNPTSNKVDYTFVQDLKKGMKVVTKTGYADIDEIKKNEDDYCYDISTEFGNYYSGDILSHNTMMSHAIVSCVTPDSMINVFEYDELSDENNTPISMEDLFKKATLEYKNMTPYEFYDISNKKLYTYSYDVSAKKVEKQQILSLVYKGEDDIYEVKSTADDKVLLKASGNHLIFDNEKQDYVKLNEIDTVKVLLVTGETVDAVIVNTGKKEPVLDLEIDKNHNYFPNSLLSHNTGGRALKFYASTRNRVTKIDTIEKNGETAGIKLKIRNYKNKTGIMFREAELTLYFDSGFDSDAEYMDFFIKLGIVKQAGAWFSYFKNKDDAEPTFKCAGRDKLQAWFDEHKDEFIACKNKVNELLSKETEELDSERSAPPEARADSLEETQTASELATLALDSQDDEKTLD